MVDWRSAIPNLAHAWRGEQSHLTSLGIPAKRINHAITATAALTGSPFNVT